MRNHSKVIQNLKPVSAIFLKILKYVALGIQFDNKQQ